MSPYQRLGYSEQKCVIGFSKSLGSTCKNLKKIKSQKKNCWDLSILILVF